jgi:hypothetical protein
VRDALDEKMDRRYEFTLDDIAFLKAIGSSIEYSFKRDRSQGETQKQ